MSARALVEANMSSTTARWFGYGFGAALAKALFGDDEAAHRERWAEPIRHQTEEEIRADERRFAEEARALDEADRAAKR